MSKNVEDPEEVRRRRLARLAATPPSADPAPPPVSSPRPPPSPGLGKEAVAAGGAAASSPRPPSATKAPAAASPRAGAPAESPGKRLGSVDKLLRRCLKMAVTDAPKGGGSIFEARPADLGGARELSAANCERALALRVEKVTASEDALGVLSDCFMRLRDEGRNARSRGDAEGADAAAKAGEACAALAARCLAEPGSLGPRSAESRASLAASLCGTKGVPLRPEFLAVALRGVAPAKLPAVAAPVVDGAVSLLRAQGATEGESARACGALAAFLQSGGKKVAGDAVAQHSMFASPPLEAPGAIDAASNPFGGLGGGGGALGGLLQAMAAAAAANGGAAFEQGTALGMVMRLGGADPADATARSELAGLLRNRRGGAVEGSLAQLGGRARVARDAAGNLVDALVKNGPTSRDACTSWFAALLSRSKDANAMQLDPRKVPSAATRLNACGCLLRLCRPVIGKADREANVARNLDFLGRSALGRAAYPDDLTRVYASGEQPSADAMDTTAESDDDMYDDDDDDAALKAALAMSKEPAPAADAEFHFVTVVFFLAFRAMHLGLCAELRRHEDMADRLGHMAHRHGHDHPQILEQQAAHVIAEASLLEETTVDDALSFCGLACRWLLSLSDDDLRKCPEFFLEDVADLPSTLAKFRPLAVKRSPPLDDLLKLVARCLGARERVVRSPHCRDKLAQALYECYLPRDAQHDGRHRGASAASDANVGLLLAPPTGDLADLAPALLWLFGDAEHLGFYDVTAARLRVAALVKHLWASPAHRGSFHALTRDERAFVTFANGLLNETNRLVAATMEKLPAIRDHQVRTGVLNPGNDPQLLELRRDYENAGEQRRQELDERHQEAERYLTSDLRLCTETLGLVELLTGDSVVSDAFALDSLRPRLAGMLLSVMRAFTGRRSMDIKIEHPEKYGFDPKDILSRVGRIATHFAQTPNFAAALAESGYYQPDLLPKTAATLRRIRGLDDASLANLDALAVAAASAKDAAALDDGIEEDAPDEFVDPLTCAMMTDPVALPSGQVVDNSTIQQHLLNELTDPFSRTPMEPKDVTPLPDLKAKIEAWLADARAKRKRSAMAT